MKSTEDLLYELGYDNMDLYDNDGQQMRKFMRDMKREVKREIRSYLEFMNDTSNDYYIEMKNGVIKRK